MPPNTPVFLLGLCVGTVLLVMGLMLGFFFGRRSGVASQVVDREQFLLFLRNLSNWTSEFAGDVTKYQNELTTLSARVQGDAAPPREEIVSLLTQIMQANQQLQQRLDSAEARLESQTHQIADYLTEARTDGLTGLANRKAFDQTLDELFMAWQSKKQAFSLVLIDIDHFKSINDTYGHPAGDSVLKKLAEILRAEFRDAVCVARYGGEEFAVLTLLPAVDTAEWLDRVRAEVSRQEFLHESTRIPVSLSGGAAGISGDDKPGKIVRRSDEALYASKQGGRNRVHLHDGNTCRLVTRVAASKSSEQPPTPAQLDAQKRVNDRLERIVEEESRRVAGVERRV